MKTETFNRAIEMRVAIQGVQNGLERWEKRVEGDRPTMIEDPRRGFDPETTKAIYARYRADSIAALQRELDRLQAEFEAL